MIAKKPIFPIPLYFLIMFSLCIISACAPTKESRRKSQEYSQIYKEQFKLVYIRKFLKITHNNSLAVHKIIHEDHSGFTEVLLQPGDFMLIDSLTSSDNKFLVADSAQGSRRAEGAQGKRSFGYLLNLIESKRLDSLAQESLKRSGVPKDWGN